MLNELCQLADALDKANITPKEWHKDLKPLPKATAKKPCFIIYISDDGSISSINTANEENVNNLRKWASNAGDSFPGFNIISLYRIVDEDNRKLLKKILDCREPIDTKVLKGWCTEKNRNWDNNVIDRANKSLTKRPKELLELLQLETNMSETSLYKLLERVLQYPETKLTGKQNKNAFMFKLENYLLDSLSSNNIPKELLQLLIGDKASDDPQSNISVFLDIDDWHKYEYPVANLKSINLINELLIKSKKEQDDTELQKLDAFGKKITTATSFEKLPGVKLPLLGDVKLRAMFDAHKCQYRYGTIDAVSFPIGQESRIRAKGALEWLGDDSHEGETWGRADTKELIFAYPSTLPKVSVKLTSCFGARKSDDSETRFANAAQDAIKGLQGITKDLRNLNLSVFSLKKMDKARTKVVFHRNYTAQRLADAAEEWQTGCSNIPELRIRAWGKTKGEWEIFEPVVPYPLQIAQSLNRVWKMDGTTECETPVIPRTQGIELLLEEHSEMFTPHLLSVLLQNSKGLLLFLGNAMNRGDIISLKGLDAHKLLIPSILGLLLYKLGYKKEDYMNNAPFLVGRMLKLADELHALYCKEVRKNSLPPQLIGNTLMTAALDSPIQALAQLALRLKPYYGWARTFQEGESAKLAGYFIGLYGDTAAQLSNFELPTRFNDPERAQVLLGYLAANPKKGEKQKNTSNTESIDSNKGEKI